MPRRVFPPRRGADVHFPFIWTDRSGSRARSGMRAANRILGSLQDVFAGNDSEAQILADLGLHVTQLAKLEIDTDLAGSPPAGNVDGRAITNIGFDGDTPPEPIAGWWDYDGRAGTAILLVVKAGNAYAAYLYDDAPTADMTNLGLRDTSDLADKGASHLSAYAVPEPTTLLLLAGGVIGLVVQGRPRTAAQAPRTISESAS